MRRGQISIEHLFMVFLALLIIIPGTSLFYAYSKNSNHQMVSNQIDRIGDEIMKNAEIVYFLGEDSRMRMTLSFPRTMNNINITSDELVISYTSYVGQNEAVFFPQVPVAGRYGANNINIMPVYHTGTVNLILENVNSQVNIYEETD